VAALIGGAATSILGMTRRRPSYALEEHRGG